ncbi:hypothetical protein CHLRE_10g463400v5 [Chlamydomonas reinhardtii]|uniref:Uncharacterized protein n=1 Tax=Chlamydomonas reinhardtii TaxID=3055 RepID=A0A2K3DC19_CHLRE|nr:uncharacterized protein CHLRE_10g463400v5 [Chlamydomonas reinhardtii]PNW78077.1 hypothetical protein CHLRE_10g463400v5 [Chlamydomonas reinhardtii]
MLLSCGQACASGETRGVPGSWVRRRLRGGRALAQLPGLAGVNGFEQQVSGATPTDADPQQQRLGLVPPPPPPPPTGNGKSNSTHMITSGRIDTVTTTELVGMAIAGFAAGLVGIALALWVRRLECTRTLLSASKSWKVILSRQLSSSGSLEERPAAATTAPAAVAPAAPAPAAVPATAVRRATDVVMGADQRSSPAQQLLPRPAGPPAVPAQHGVPLPPVGQVARRDGQRAQQVQQPQGLSRPSPAAVVIGAAPGANAST